MEGQDNHEIDIGIVSDDFKFPFSLRTAFRRRDFKKVGEVSDCMDKLIGRPVIFISGVVSANNYIEYQDLKLVGNFIYIQLRLSNSFVTTFHLEITTTESISLRITASTLYQGDKPRFLGRSLRLPLPTVEGWIVLCLDMNSILAKYCCSSKSQKGSPLSMVALKKVQLCSTMAFRDLITSDKELHSDPKLVLKELSVKPDMEPIPWLSMLTICEQSLVDTRSTPQKLLLQNNNSPLFNANASPAAVFPASEVKVQLPLSENRPTVYHIQSGGPNLLASPPPQSSIEKRFGSMMSQSPAAVIGSCEKPPLTAKPYITTVVSKDLTSQHESKNVKLPPTAVVKYSIPRVHSSDKVMQMERLLGYAGGPTALLMNGELVVTASGHNIVLLDLRRRDPTQPTVPSHKGLWKAFQSSDECDGYKQAFLKGHKFSIGVIETTEKETYMITGETTVANPMIILWDLNEGKRLASLRPHSTALCSAAFSPSGSMLVTVGLDPQNRIQISLWDVQAMIREKGTIIGYKSSLAPAASGTPVSMMCRQISDFDISRIRFCPWDETTLVSGGRENIRFWRIRKGHLPGRPVLLNEYSRGYSFKDIAFYANHEVKRGKESGDDRVGKRIGDTEVLSIGAFVFACCNKGLLLKINFNNEQVLCAYQLHQPTVVICSLSIHSGYAVTGGDDHKLRIWPMDFGDFLLESHHEGPITNIRVSRDGRSQIIGSSTGTLGLLNVSEHRYNTVMRSHVGPIVAIVGRGPFSPEFTTIGSDKTIRVWDALSATQIVEFASERDDPTSGAYHPLQSEHLFACGFGSGHVRIFDIDNAVSVYEKKGHMAGVTGVLYFSPTSSQLYLASAGLDGKVVLYDTANRYDTVRSLTISTEPVTAISITANRSGSLLAVGLSHLSSIVLFETTDYSVVLQLASLASVITSNGITTSPLQPPSHSNQASPGLGTMQTEKRSLFSITMNSYPGRSDGQDPSLASNNHLLAPLVSMVFITDDIVEQALLVVTDRHLISIPLTLKDTLSGEDLEERDKFRIKKLLSPWDKRSVKRFEFGSPTGLCRDENSGLLFVIAKRPELSRRSSGEGSKRLSRTSILQNIENTIVSRNDMASDSVSLSITSPPLHNNLKNKKSVNNMGDTDDSGAYCVSATSNAVVLMDARHKYFDRLKLSVSSASSSQLFENPCGSIVGVCPCLSSGKVVLVDSSGTIVIWNVHVEKLEKIKIDTTLDSPPEPDRKINHVELAAHGRERLFQSPTDLAYGRDEQRGEWLGSLGACVDLAALGVSAASAEKKIAVSDALTRDFARAVTFDPSQWSSNTKQDVSPQQPLQNRNQSVGEGKTEYAAMFGWMDPDNSPVLNPGVAHTHESKSISRESSPEKDGDFISLQQPMSSDRKEVPSPVDRPNPPTDKSNLASIDRSSWYVAINDMWVKHTASQLLFKSNGKYSSDGDRNVDLISHVISVKPSLSPSRDALLLTDNYNVVYRGVSVDSKSTLELPVHLNGSCFVTAVALSPSGTYSAAVLSKALGANDVDDAVTYVCLWRKYGSKYKFFGYAEAGVQKISNISWDTEDCLMSMCAVYEPPRPSTRDTHMPAMFVKVSVLCITSVNTLVRWANKTDTSENIVFTNGVLQECFDANSFMLPLHSVQKLLSGIVLLPYRQGDSHSPSSYEGSNTTAVAVGAVTENRLLPILICTDTNIFCVSTTLNYVRTDVGGRMTDSAVLVNLQNTKIVWTNGAALGTTYLMMEATSISPSITVVAVLNSISQVIFSSFLMVDTIPKICYQKDQKNVRSLSCKVPVANVSGSLTCFAVSADGQQQQQQQQTSDGGDTTIRLMLLFGATHGAKVYTVSLNYLSVSNKSFAMKIHSKMRLAFTPVFVCFSQATSADSKQLNMLLISSDGHIGVMNTTKKLIAGVKNPVRYVDMQCPPPIIDKKDDDAGSVGMKSLLLLPGAKSDDDIVAFLSSRGELSYYTRKNGILLDRPVYMSHDQWLRELLQTSTSGEVFYPDALSAAPSLNDFIGTCISYLDGYDLLITGTACGKICFYDRHSFDCMKIFQLDKPTDPLSLYERMKYPTSRAGVVLSHTSSAIESTLLIAVDGSRFVLVVVQRNGSVTLLEVATELSSSAQQSLSLSSRLVSSVRSLKGTGEEHLTTNGSAHTMLVQCVGGTGDGTLPKSFVLLRSDLFYLYELLYAVDGDSSLSYRQVVGFNLSGLLNQRLGRGDDASSSSTSVDADTIHFSGERLNIVGGHVISVEGIDPPGVDDGSSSGNESSNDSDYMSTVNSRSFALYLVASSTAAHDVGDRGLGRRYGNCENNNDDEINNSNCSAVSYLLTCALTIPASDRNAAVCVRIEQETTINSSLEAVAFSGDVCYVCTAEAIFRIDLTDLSDLRRESPSDELLTGVASYTTIEAVASETITGNWKGSKICTYGFNPISDGTCGLLVLRFISPAILFYKFQ